MGRELSGTFSMYLQSNTGHNQMFAALQVEKVFKHSMAGPCHCPVLWAVRTPVSRTGVGRPPCLTPYHTPFSPLSLTFQRPCNGLAWKTPHSGMDIPSSGFSLPFLPSAMCREVVKSPHPAPHPSHLAAALRAAMCLGLGASRGPQATFVGFAPPRLAVSRLLLLFLQLSSGSTSMNTMAPMCHRAGRSGWGYSRTPASTTTHCAETG